MVRKRGLKRSIHEAACSMLAMRIDQKAAASRAQDGVRVKLALIKAQSR